jgi:hypothetical protein
VAPISEDTKWFIAVQNGQAGPFTADQMREFLRDGHLTMESYIWRDGFDNWVPLANSSDLEAFKPASEPAAQPQQQADGAQQAPAAAGAAAAQPAVDEGAKTVEASAKKPAAVDPLASGTGKPVDFGMHQDDDYLDGVFVDLVKNSWKRHRRRQLSTEVDEVLVGGVITGVLDNGYSMIDLTSDGQNHYARFEDIDTGNRVIFQLQHMAESLLTSKVLGHEANVTIGYGTRVRDFGKTWKAVRQEMKGGYIQKADPGIITIDGDMTSQYIYVMVGLIWDIEDYLSPDDPYKVLYPKLGKDVGATLHSLRKYLHGRFGG